jgi:Antistasin family
MPRLQLVSMTGLLLLMTGGCGSISVSPDGGGAGNDGGTGAAGHGTGQSGSTGSTGTAGVTGSGGSTGAAGATGSAGTTGAAGRGGSGGSTGVAGTTGSGGSGAAGRGGSGGGGTSGMCGPVCNIYCPYGNVTDPNGCPTCQCNPAPPVCSMTECGPPPPYAYPMCPTGATVIPAACTRGTDGKCAWHAPTCGNPCPQGTHQVACPQIACGTDCLYGNTRDATGCTTCACRPVPNCAPAGVACVSCPFGYRVGPNQCRTCACEDPPAGCAANAAGMP